MNKFQILKKKFSQIDIPSVLNFPFYYTPSPIAKLACEQLQDELKTWPDTLHNFGFNKTESNLPVIGKMFGVLVVQNIDGEIGFLKTFSGSLQGKSSLLNDFVMPITPQLNLEETKNKYKKRVDEINIQINKIEKDLNHHNSENYSIKKEALLLEELEQLKAKYKKDKIERDYKRNTTSNPETLKYLAQESSFQKKRIKEVKLKIKQNQREHLRISDELKTKIKLLSNERKDLLKDLQIKILDSQFFYNSKKEKKSLFEIFRSYQDRLPNSGSGDCCAPKLLNYAFKHNLKPISIAEFWWGAPPKNNIRKHGYYYPACTTRCGPILNFMLNNTELEKNPFLINYGEGKTYTKIYEDNDILIVDKPEGLLTTPGLRIKDSLQTRIQNEYRSLSHIMPIHRLDQGTSGLVIFAKNKNIHTMLQKLLNQKRIKKLYQAIILGSPKIDKGKIELPLSLDSDNPPFHMVNLKAGKKAITIYKVLERSSQETLIEFEPITGRTHQLRIHSAHINGLNCPIKGDDMYGIKDQRMYLHAKSLEFIHPISHKKMHLKSASGFSIKKTN